MYLIALNIISSQVIWSNCIMNNLYYILIFYQNITDSDCYQIKIEKKCIFHEMCRN
jgi:hypothetical protein